MKKRKHLLPVLLFLLLEQIQHLKTIHIYHLSSCASVICPSLTRSSVLRALWAKIKISVCYILISPRERWTSKLVQFGGIHFYGCRTQSLQAYQLWTVDCSQLLRLLSHFCHEDPSISAMKNILVLEPSQVSNLL